MSWLRDDSKTEKATPRKREKVRGEGSVARSPELTSAIMLFVSTVLLFYFGPSMMNRTKVMMAEMLGSIGQVDLTVDALPQQLGSMMLSVAAVLVPLFATIMTIGVAVNVAQVGFRITPKAAYPNFARLNPMTGIGRLFSAHSIVELLKNIVKVVAVAFVLYAIVKSQLGALFSLANVPAASLPEAAGGIVGEVMLLAALCLVVIGLLDYFYNRHEHEQSIKMTKEEVREEARQADGDPAVRGKIREIMIRRTIQRMMKKVPEADVVITNPIHLAIALKYDREKSAAPVVVAKGARKVAERIKEIAREHGVPVVENRPLAQALFKTVEIGQEIPAELFKAVAEVLAYVYRLKKKYFGVA